MLNPHPNIFFHLPGNNNKKTYVSFSSLFPWQLGNVVTRAVQLLFKEELLHEKESECDEPKGYKYLGKEEEESTVREGDGHRSK